ncbi:hypothetical protein PVA17_07395 [Lysinibacillus sp. CNPSo 3705]|uniref:hypothetical protein n=1 Tax=Lysinibacillus sp. CNPSo 3705 TaxID=3028148 RepID=UPI00236479F7|nr:hypothetical protein [Lysinibacillus sp. CNPSo 3705]MDD1502591.1 hypothetical protein [Lysinibacillus sp. CNPSo 3705]
MTVVGGNLERKEIGLTIGVSGTHYNTEINRTTGLLQLMQIDVDGHGNPIYTKQGSWTSDVVDLGDKFKDFEKVFTTNTNKGASSFAILTRVSDNGIDWSNWTAIAMDGAIQSDTKQFIQVRIDLFAGFVVDEFIIAKSDFEKNEFIEEREVSLGRYVTPKLTSNTSSLEGFAFSATEFHTGNYPPWKAFDKADTSEGYITKSGVIEGILGFCFNSGKRITKYKIRSMAYSSVLNSMPKNWIVQGSNDTTDGINGSWYDLDTQSNQIWTTANTDKVFDITNNASYRAFRINWTANNNFTAYSGIGELDFYEDGATALNLKREYENDMTLDKTWSDTGSIHKKKINRNDWVKIDKLEVRTID